MSVCRRLLGGGYSRNTLTPTGSLDRSQADYELANPRSDAANLQQQAS
jgi:hypothetical protein